MIGSGDGNHVDRFVFEQLANIALKGRFFALLRLLDTLASFLANPFIDIANMSNFDIAVSKHTADVFATATIHAYNGNMQFRIRRSRLRLVLPRGMNETRLTCRSNRGCGEGGLSQEAATCLIGHDFFSKVVN